MPASPPAEETTAQSRYILVLRDTQSGVDVGEIYLNDFRRRFWEAFVVSKAAMSGVEVARERVWHVVSTARDPRAPEDLRRGSVCGVLLLDLAMRAVAYCRGYAPVPPPPPAPEPIEAEGEVFA
jgi:hypothetical protein